MLIAGKECTVRPLGIRELTEVERDCAERYKRQYLKTFADNLDLLPAEAKDRLLLEKMDVVARWDVDDLPPKFVHDPARVKMTDKLKSWVGERIEVAASWSNVVLMKWSPVPPRSVKSSIQTLSGPTKKTSRSASRVC